MPHLSSICVGSELCTLQHHGDRRIDGRDLLERDEIRQRVEPETVVLLGNHHPEEAELAELADERRLEVRVAIPLRRVNGAISLGGKLARDRLDRALLFGERGERPGHRLAMEHRCGTARAIARAETPRQYA